MCKEKKKENLEIRSMHLEPKRFFETIKPFGSHIFREIQRAKPKGKEGIVGTGEKVPGRCEQEAAIHGALPWLQRTSAPQAQTPSDHADIEGENPRAKGTNGFSPLFEGSGSGSGGQETDEKNKTRNLLLKTHSGGKRKGFGPRS